MALLAVAAALALSVLVSPRLAAAGLALFALFSLRLWPRKCIDIGWRDLASAVYSVLFLSGGLLRAESRRERAAIEAAIEALWHPPPPAAPPPPSSSSSANAAAAAAAPPAAGSSSGAF